MTPNYSAVLDFDYQLRRHVRKRNRAMFEKNIFHFSDFFLDKIDFNLDKIDFNLNKKFLLYLIFFFNFSDFLLDKIDFNLDKIDFFASSLLWKLVGRNPSRRAASKRITRCDSLTSTYDHSINIALFLIKLTIHHI